jgi:hypothetical protein
MEYGMTVRTTAPFADTLARVREALKAQGFGVLTEIDVRATLRDKLGEDMEDYLILGACNPHSPTGPSPPIARSGCCCHATWLSGLVTAAPLWRHSIREPSPIPRPSPP